MDESSMYEAAQFQELDKVDIIDAYMEQIIDPLSFTASNLLYFGDFFSERIISPFLRMTRQYLTATLSRFESYLSFLCQFPQRKFITLLPILSITKHEPRSPFLINLTIFSPEPLFTH